MKPQIINRSPRLIFTLNIFSISQIPYSDSFVVRPRNHKFSIWTKSENSDGRCVALIRKDATPPANIPQFNIARKRTRGQIIWVIKFVMRQWANLERKIMTPFLGPTGVLNKIWGSKWFLLRRASYHFTGRVYKDGPEICVARPLLSFLFCFCLARPIRAVQNFLARPLMQKCFLARPYKSEKS